MRAHNFVLAYQIWTYHFFKGKVTEEEIVY